MMTATSPSQRLPVWLQALLAGLSLWGVYLAVGATGLFSRGQIVTDPRRSLIVLTCSALFLGSWYYILRRRATLAGQTMANEAATSQAWNQASLLSTALAVAGYLSWGTAWAMWGAEATRSWTAPLGYLSAALFGASTIAALIGLSHPRHRRGQLSGLLTLLLLLLAMVLFIWQVKQYTQRPMGMSAVSVTRGQ